MLNGLEQETELQPELLGPGVYLVYVDKELIYIGKSTVLIYRLGPSIRHIRKTHPVTSVKYIPTATIELANELERRLIGWLGPTMNKQCI